MEKKELVDMIDILEETAQEVGGDIREGYSGRGMYGDECYGIVCDDATECIEVASAKGLTGARTDSMGTRTIVYYPKLKYIEE